MEKLKLFVDRVVEDLQSKVLEGFEFSIYCSEIDDVYVNSLEVFGYRIFFYDTVYIKIVLLLNSGSICLTNDKLLKIKKIADNVDDLTLELFYKEVRNVLKDNIVWKIKKYNKTMKSLESVLGSLKEGSENEKIFKIDESA
jgi:hypothetical protein